MKGIRYRRRIEGSSAEVGVTRRGEPYGRVSKKVTPTTRAEVLADPRHGLRVRVKQKIGDRTLTLERELLTRTNRISLSDPRRSRRRR